MTQKGIDISTWQGKIDWKKVKDAKIDFAIPRSGYGWENRATQTDKQFYNNLDGAAANGIPVGCYHYSYATTKDQARKEADFVMELLKDRKLGYPVFYDLEDKSQLALSRSALTDIAEAFCQEIESAGYYPGIYCSLDWARNRLDMNRLSKYDLWLAQYYYAVTYTGPYTVWQYTSTGAVNGITGNVDLNVSYKDYPGLMASLGKNGYSAPQPEHGSLLLDTKSYKMPPGSIYDVKAELTGADPNRMKVYVSRTGIASVQKLSEEKYRVTALAEGEAYLMFEVYSASGRQLNHASVKITVAPGVTPGGESNSIPSVF